MNLQLPPSPLLTQEGGLKGGVEKIMFEPHIFNSQSMKSTRRELRKHQTPYEWKLWNVLRGKKFLGLKFYRQFSVGPYVLDFYCPQLHLGIELDGRQHLEARHEWHDKQRDDLMRSHNIKTIRFPNCTVRDNMKAVLNRLKNEVVNLQLPPFDSGVLG